MGIRKDEREFLKTWEYLDGFDNDIQKFNQSQNLKFRNLNNLSEERFAKDSSPAQNGFDSNTNLFVNFCYFEIQSIKFLLLKHQFLNKWKIFIFNLK